MCWVALATCYIDLELFFSTGNGRTIFYCCVSLVWDWWAMGGVCVVKFFSTRSGFTANICPLPWKSYTLAGVLCVWGTVRIRSWRNANQREWCNKLMFVGSERSYWVTPWETELRFHWNCRKIILLIEEVLLSVCHASRKQVDNWLEWCGDPFV